MPTLDSTPVAHARSLRIFTPRFVALWLAVALITVALEVMPVHFPGFLFYTYKATKVVLFFLLGYLTPLAYWNFHKLTRGIFFAAISATAVELLQRLIGNGHTFSWFELLAKLFLIGLGFLLALEARYDREISLGPLFHLTLWSPQLDAQAPK